MKLCSQLSHDRSLSPGKAFFYYLDDGQKMQPLKIDQTRLRAPKCGYAEAYLADFKVKNVAPQDLAFSNPQYIEECYVSPGVDDIYCRFSLRIKANSLFPDVCSNVETRKILSELATTYHKLGGYKELARRYAKNILMASWVWRNRHCRNIEVVVKTENNVWKIKDARYLDWHGKWDPESQAELDKLTDYLARALSDRSRYYNMDIKAKLTVGWGDEIYPSQEFVDEKIAGRPSKQLAKVALNGTDESVAYHSQKVGAAIQLIDDWWGKDADKPLRVNEYGADKQYVIARRHSVSKRDFYSLISKSEAHIESMRKSGQIEGDIHFIMAVLVKGGVFNGASEKSKKDK